MEDSRELELEEEKGKWEQRHEEDWEKVINKKHEQELQTERKRTRRTKITRKANKQERE